MQKRKKVLTKTIRKNAKLPQEVYDKFHAVKDIPKYRNAYALVLHTAGWTLQSIADAVGVSRERIRQIINESDPFEGLVYIYTSPEFPVPELPSVEVELEERYNIEPDPIKFMRLQQLQPYAQQVRSNSKTYRREAEEYTALLNEVINVDGVTVYHLSRLLGVTHGAINFRLVRYGYKTTNGKSRAFSKIREENRSL